MIPPDVASSLRQILPDRESAGNTQTQPVPAAQRIADALSNFVPGERILAEIQALMPNGAYRAIVAQREVTLALPFSAKAGDTLELEVAESDGKPPTVPKALQAKGGDHFTERKRPPTEATLQRLKSAT